MTMSSQPMDHDHHDDLVNQDGNPMMAPDQDHGLEHGLGADGAATVRELVPMDPNPMVTYPDAFLLQFVDGYSYMVAHHLAEEQCQVVRQWAHDFVQVYFVQSDQNADALHRLVDRINVHLLPPSYPATHDTPIQSKFNSNHIEVPRSPSELLTAAFHLLKDHRDFDHRPAFDKLLKIFVDRFTSQGTDEAMVKDLADCLSRQVVSCDPFDRRIVASILSGYLLRPIRHREFLHHAAFQVLSTELEFLALLDKDEVSPGLSGRASFDQCLGYVFDCAPWNHKHMIPIIEMCKELDLSQDQWKQLVDIIVKKLLPSPGMDHNDVPILIFNALTVACNLKGPTDKRAVFGEIASYMATTAEAARNCPEPERTRRLAEQSTMEATALMHFRLALNNDTTLPRDFGAYAMALKRQELTPFNILAILMSCENKPNHPLLHHIRKELEALVKVESESQRLKWLQGFSPFEIPSPKTILQTVVQHTSHNWHVLESLIHLGCMLMDKHDPKPAPALSPASSKLPYTIAGLSFSPAHATLGHPPIAPRAAPGQPASDPSQTISALGQDLLFDLYAQHDLVRAHILDRIRTHLANDAPTAVHYLTLLSTRVLASPALVANLMAQHLPHVRQLLDVVATHAGPLAMGLLCALVPLTRWDPGLREAVVLLLRKGLLHKHHEVREVAVVGGVRLLAVVSALEAGFAKRFRLEVVGLVSAVGALDAGLRQLYYQQLMTAMAGEAGTHVAALVLQSLHTQLERVLDKGNGWLIQFDQCVDGVDVVEPVHWLVKCITVAVTHCSQDVLGDVEKEQRTKLVATIKLQLRQCAEKMRAMDLSDYGIPATAPFSFNEQVHAEMYVLANLITATYEAVLEFVAMMRPPPTACSMGGAVATPGPGGGGSGRAGGDQLLEALYNRGRESMDAIRTRFVDAKGKKKPTQPLHCDSCLIDPSTLYALQETLNMPDRQLMAKLSSAVHLSSESQQRSLVNLAKVFLAQLVPANIGAVARRAKDYKGKGEQSLAMFAVESLETVIKRVLMYDDFAEHLAAMARGDHAAGVVDEGLSLVQMLMQSVEALIDAEYVSEATKLIGVLDLLLPWLSSEDARVLGACIVELLMGGTTLADYKVLRELLSLLIRVAWDDMEQLGSTLETIASHVLHELGQLSATTMSMANEYCPHPLPTDLVEDDRYNVDLRDAKNQQWFVKVVLRFVGEMLDELDWTFKEYKVEFGKKGQAPSLECRAAFESRVAKRLYAALVPIHILSVIAAPYALAEAMYRSLIHTFNTTITYLQLKRSMDTRPEDKCTDVIKRASALRHWVHQLGLHFDKQAVAAAAEAKEKEQTKKAKAATKGKGKGKAGGVGKGKGKAAAKQEDSDDDDELMDEDGGEEDSDQRSVTSGTGTVMTGAAHMTPEQKAQAKLVRRQRALGNLAADLVEKGELFDAQIIALANIYSSLNKFVRRSAVHDVRLPAARAAPARVVRRAADDDDEFEDGPAPAKRSRRT